MTPDFLLLLRPRSQLKLSTVLIYSEVMRMMSWLTRFTFLLVATLYLTSAEDPEPLQVQYKSQTFTSSPGSSVKLICQTYYDPEQCGQVHAVWFVLEPDFPLTDPEKYLTIVNETITDNNWRLRQVLTEILDLSSKDTGRYQCQATAECNKSKTITMGHFINVTVASNE